MRKSLYFRNFAMMASVVVFSFAILGGMFFAWSYRLIIDERKETMESSMPAISSMFSAGLENGLGGPMTQFYTAMLSSISGFDLLVTDSNGLVIACSDASITHEYSFECEHLGHHVPQESIESVLKGENYNNSTRLGGVYADHRHVLGAPITLGDTNLAVGFVFMTSPQGRMVSLWRDFASSFMMIAVVVVFATFVISLVMTKKSAEPINEMAYVARRFARGDFTVRATEVGRIDEIGQLTLAFNSMADSLERSEKLRREFIANVSHELKTPMTSIAGFADGILDGTIPHENEAKYLEIISSETRRLSRLVKNMLDMSRIQEKTKEELLRNDFDVAEVVRISLLSLGTKIDGKTLDVEAELPEEPIFVQGDKDSITQVVYNLIDNAVKFSPEGGVIRLGLWKQGGHAYVSVENSGATIPEDEMPLIFDRFHKLDKARSENKDGVGLGLYIVKTILDNHNEDIYVTSADGVTRFTFTLSISTKGKDAKERKE